MANWGPANSSSAARKRQREHRETNIAILSTRAEREASLRADLKVFKASWERMREVVNFFEEVYPHEITSDLRTALEKPFPKKDPVTGAINLHDKRNRQTKSGLGMINYIAKLVPEFSEWTEMARSHFKIG